MTQSTLKLRKLSKAGSLYKQGYRYEVLDVRGAFYVFRLLREARAMAANPAAFWRQCPITVDSSG